MYKAGFVTLVGKPNVGKSTLLNALIGEKVSIISPKPQTTRKSIRGILTTKDYQIVFQDCPGFTRREDALNAFIREEIRKALEDTDLICYMVEAKRPDPLDEVKNYLKDAKRPAILVINKVDLVSGKRVGELKENYEKSGMFKKVIPISALRGEGLDELVEAIVSELPERPPFYPEDYITDMPIRFLASEIIREKAFLYLKEEVPYSVYVSIEEFDEREDLVYIRAYLYVERESQKGIIIGSGGEMIKRISTEARKDIEVLVGKKVYLELRVKVHKKWSKKAGFFRRYGRDLIS